MKGGENINGYRIYNSLGMLMANKQVEISKKTDIDLSAYDNGIYFIEVMTDKNKKYIKKIEIVK